MSKNDELNAVVPENETAESTTEAAPDEKAEVSTTEAALDEEAAPAETKKKKKGPFIQIPVLISLGIILLTAIGYFVYSAYFLHLPQGIIWSQTKDDIAHYYEFSDDNMFTHSYASYEESVSYDERAEGDENVLRLYYPDGNVDLKYSMSGSRILKNQKLTLTNSAGADIADCDEVDSRTSVLELPTEEVADKNLVGEWEFVYTPSITYRVWFNADGSMRYEVKYTYDEHTYIEARNLTYTTADGNVNYTLASIVDDESTGKPKIRYDVIPEAYELNGNRLIFLKAEFTRVGGDATPDEGTTE